MATFQNFLLKFFTYLCFILLQFKKRERKKMSLLAITTLAPARQPAPFCLKKGNNLSLRPYVRPTSSCLSIANLHVRHYQIQAEYDFYCISRVQDVPSSWAAQRRGCVHTSCAAISHLLWRDSISLSFPAGANRGWTGQSPLMWGTGLGCSDGRYLER